MNSKQSHSVRVGSVQVNVLIVSAVICAIVLAASFNGAPSEPAANNVDDSVSPRAVCDPELSLADRVAYQYAIEEVYWRHRIWPKEGTRPKPRLNDVISQAQLQQKVDGVLRDSKLLADRGQTITPEQLQTEMERIARNTKQPAVLRELFMALNNDPALIAECLARQILVERRVRDLSPQGLDPQPNQPFESSAAMVRKASSRATGELNVGYTLPEIAGPSTTCADDTWTATTTVGAPVARDNNPAIWTGSEMIVWGQSGDSSGGKYYPSTDTWTATTTTNAPTDRYLYTAIWTGSEMIVWGGDANPGYLNTGARYNPVTDVWVATTTANAPAARREHTAVWTGSEMIVWGGSGPGFSFGTSTGGRYNPSTDSWVATTTTGAAIGRFSQSAVWTGSEMIVWGGFGNTGYTNTGGRYKSSTDSWISTSTTGAPSARSSHTAVWTGSEMIVWGGQYNGSVYEVFNSGGRYDPSTNSWVATNITGVTGRAYHTTVWTGNEMIVWGGADSNSDILNSGDRYTPTTDSWVATSTINAPTERYSHGAVWTGSEMIIWGGENYDGLFDTGGSYCVQGPFPTPPPSPTPAGSPTPTPTPPPLTPTPTPTTSPTPPGPTPTSTPPPAPTSTPVDCGARAFIYGSAFNCSAPLPTATPPANPTPPPPVPVPGVLITASGSSSGVSATTDGSGNYSLTVLAGFNTSYTLTPSKGALAPGSGSINTTDVLAIERHFLGVTIIPTGCRLNAADVVIDGAINTQDVIAAQRFYIGLTSGIGSAGQYKFLPANRFLSLHDCSVSTGNNFNTYVVGDVAAPIALRASVPDHAPGERSRELSTETTLPSHAKRSL